MAYCYKNTSVFANTFYGVTFEPGEIKEVPGPIHHVKFVRLCEMPKPVAAPKLATSNRGRKPKESTPEAVEAEPAADTVEESESTTESKEETSTQEVM